LGCGSILVGLAEGACAETDHCTDACGILQKAPAIQRLTWDYIH